MLVHMLDFHSVFIFFYVGEAGEITVGHLVLGIWSEKESPGHKVLAALGFDSENAKKLAKIVSFFFFSL